MLSFALTSLKSGVWAKCGEQHCKAEDCDERCGGGILEHPGEGQQLKEFGWLSLVKWRLKRVRPGLAVTDTSGA